MILSLFPPVQSQKVYNLCSYLVFGVLWEHTWSQMPDVNCAKIVRLSSWCFVRTSEGKIYRTLTSSGVGILRKAESCSARFGHKPGIVCSDKSYDFWVFSSPSGTWWLGCPVVRYPKLKQSCTAVYCSCSHIIKLPCGTAEFLCAPRHGAVSEFPISDCTDLVLSETKPNLDIGLVL